MNNVLRYFYILVLAILLGLFQAALFSIGANIVFVIIILMIIFGFSIIPGLLKEKKISSGRIFFLIAFVVFLLLFISLATSEKSNLTRNIESNYQQGIEQINSKNWKSADELLYKVIQINPNYKEVRKKVEIVRNQLIRQEMSKQNQENQLNIKSRREAIMKRYCMFREINFNHNSDKYVKIYFGVDSDVHYTLIPGKITWLNKKQAKLEAVQKLQKLSNNKVVSQEKILLLFTFTDSDYEVKDISESGI